MRTSQRAVLLAACAGLLSTSPPSRALQSAGNAPKIPAPRAAPTDPRAVYQALNELRPDAARVYAVHGLNLRRDAASLTLGEGKLAFLQSLGGRVTGAVFSGRGHITATPRDPGERRSLAQFLGVPILDQTFSSAYLRFTDDTAAEIEQQLKSAGSEATSDPEFVENWRTAVATLNPWHSLRILLDWFSTDPVPYFYAGLSGDSVGRFDMLVDPRRDEQVQFGQPLIKSGTILYNVWASFRSADAPATPRDTFSPLDYHVDTTIADDLSLDGKTTLHLKTQRGGEQVVPLELSRNLAVEEVRSEAGLPLVFFQNEDISRRDIARRGNDLLLVVLPAPAPPGEEFHLQVSYHGSVISDAGNGVEFVGERGRWYVHIAGRDHFVPFELSFHWPKRFVLVATGTRVESQDDGETKAGRWRSEVPFAVAGFNLGEYKVETASGERPRVQLYANRELENAILERLGYGSFPLPLTLPPILPPSSGTTRMQQITPPPPPPSPSAVLKHLGGEVLDSIHFFEKLNGPFPFEHLDVSQIPGSFGQGWPGLVYLSTYAFLPPETQERAGVRGRAQEEIRDLMPFHEVAHQWWGNMVGSASYRDTWIEEGIANYLAILYAEKKRPDAHRMTNWLEHFRTALVEKMPGSDETPDDAGPLSLGYRLETSTTPEAYETVIYGKGTWVIHMLHEMLRDPAAKDPDARFRNLLRSILTEYRFHALSTADFQRAVERQMTPSMDLEDSDTMDWFFEQWVRGTGIPHYAVKFQVKPRGQEFVVTGVLQQTGVGDNFTAAVPLYAARAGAKPERLGAVVTTGPQTRFHLLSRFHPTRILIDPHLTLLCRTN